MRQSAMCHVCLLLPCLGFAAGNAWAAGARTGVNADHGEMVVLREVSSRHAVRAMPPGIGLIVDPTPNRQLMPALAGGELSDADFLALDTGQQVRGPTRASGIATPVTQVLAGTLVGGANARSASGLQSAGSLGAASGGVLGAVGSTTRGIGGHVTGALSQLPFGQPAQGKGP